MTKLFRKIVLKRENVLVVAQEYAEKPKFIKFWRYIVYINGIVTYRKDMLTSKPDIKKIAEKY